MLVMENVTLQRLEDYIHETLSVRVRAVPWSGAGKLPLFLTDRYEFFSMTVLDRPCILALDRKTEALTPASIRKQLDIVGETAMLDVVYVSATLSGWNRTRLIEQKQSFIVPGNQLYLPLLALDLREYTRLPAKSGVARKLSPSSVRVLLYILYAGDRTEWTLTDISEALGISSMSVSRTFDEFSDAGLFRIEMTGKVRRLRRDQPGRDVWKRAEPLARSPLMKKVPIELKSLPAGLPCAGLTALSEASMLASPAIPEYALSSARWKQLKQDKLIREVPYADTDTVLLEIWRYDPEGFSKNGTVDPISLYLTLRGTDDERIAAALDELLDGVPW